MTQNAIWLIAGGTMQAPVARRIKELGYKLILSDGAKEPFCMPLADLCLEVDTFDVQSHLKIAENIRQQFNIRAVVTSAADCHQVVAYLGKHLGLSHLDPEISEICRNKAKTREFLKSSGIPYGEFHFAKSFADASNFLINRSHKSWVIKATDNSGSRGFQRLEKGQTFTKQNFDYSVESGTTGGVLIEEELVHDETQISESSVETIWFDGKMYWMNWVDRIFARDLHHFPVLQKYYQVGPGIEIGHINPANHPSEVKRLVERDMEHAGRALGMHKLKGAHFLKGDIFFTKEGPRILELTPRTSGGWDSTGSSIARGANVVGGVVDFSLGKDLDLDMWFRYFQFKDVEKRAVVLTYVPPNAVDCVSRKFAMHSGHEDLSVLLSNCLSKIKESKFLVPVL